MTDGSAKNNWSGAAEPALSALALMLVAPGVARAEVETFKGEYTVSYLGLTIARSTFESRFEDGKFSGRGYGCQRAGIAVIFDRTKGRSSASPAASPATVPNQTPSAWTTPKQAEADGRSAEIPGRRCGQQANVPPLKKLRAVRPAEARRPRRRASPIRCRPA